MGRLFDKTKIKNIELKNRFVRSATYEGLADDVGHINSNYIKFYERLSKGGIGLIITGYSTVFEYDKPSIKISGIYNDSFIEEYKKVTQVIHNNGSKVIAQIVLGKEYKSKEDKYEAFGFDDSMKKSYIDDIINAFAEAALRCKKAGFDGVQLHGAHGYFLSRTLNKKYNRRSDKYGINKETLIVEVYDKVRELVGEDYIVGIKINSCDRESGEEVFKDCLKACIELDKRGLDFIEVSGGDFGQAKYKNQESIYAKYSNEISINVKCPVMLVALNRTPRVMEGVLNSTEIDYISICRPTICEPELISRWENGDLTKGKCISCGKCYIDEEGNKCILNKAN